ncbi:hypothetical protein K7I13_01785 [Brucepastera parasyntrophica]|uniref:hypothetical protein n=1 Tax=Brucepastera parasyntrophica TaxID=2880008 RepID=UPI00210C9C5B|nr:hypothetical protein [Brucepastera parasyntrophica]ULQ60084.1 hypothetical protein K7I13_01785 [Brucepastera parasyntrophica]
MQKKDTIGTITLPETSAVSDSARFALIVDPYISIRDKPGEDGITVSHGRRGSIFEVKGRRILKSGNSQIIWINIDDGWIPGPSVHLYSNYEQAQTAAELLR